MGICGPKVEPPAPIPEVSKDNVANVLQQCYEQKIAPFERRHNFEAFHTPTLLAPEFNSKPMVLFLGQYSVGKTTMIKYLMGGHEYPGAMIGPEPTTDCFVVIHYSEAERNLMGTTLASDTNMPFQSLNQFGASFLTHLRGASLPVDMLKHVFLIDTPGILSGQKQTHSREYDFASVVRFLADKVDMIIMLFDTSKLDISDEYKLVLTHLKGNEEKIKIVLNKADSVEPGELVRVRGALMWSLSKIMSTPEVPKVFIGSFSIPNKNTKNSEVLNLFKDDYADLFKELERLPTQHLARKVNDVIKRAKSVRVHALIMDQIMKGMWYKSDKQRALMLRDKKLKAIFLDIRLKHRLAESDMPDYDTFKDCAQKSYLKSWNRINPKLLLQVEEFLEKDVTKICENLPNEDPGAASLKKAFDEILAERNEAIEALAAEKASTPSTNNNEEKKEASKKLSLRKETSKKSLRKPATPQKSIAKTPTKSAAAKSSPKLDATQKEDGK